MPISTKRTGGVLPDGVYKFIIEEAKEEDRGNKPCIVLRLRPFINGEKGGSAVFDNLFLTDNSRWRVEMFLDAVGVGEDEAQVPARWFEGRPIWAKVSSSEYEGRWRNDVKRFLTPDQADAEIERMAELEGTDEDAPIIKTKRNTRPVPASAPKASKQPVVAEMEDQEDIPF